MRLVRALRSLWSQPGRWPRLLVVVACLAIVVMYWRNDDNAGMPDAPRGTGQYLPILDRGDGHMLYLMARSTAADRDWDFANDLKRFGDPWVQPTNPATGRAEIPHPIGPALIWTPLIWFAQAGAVVANAFGADIAAHAYTNWHQRFVFMSSALAAIVAMLLALRLARRFVGGTWAPAYAAIAVLLGTSLTYYATYMPSYGHALDALACAAFLAAWALTLGRTDWRRWVVLGALLGIAMLIRVQDLALGIVIVVEVVAAIVSDLRRRAIDWRMRALILVGGGMLTLLVALVVFTPQLYYWHVVYGDWASLPQGSKYTRLGSPMFFELLFAPRNGWLSTHPIAYLGTLGLVCLPRRARVVAIAFALALVTQVYLNATIIDWWAMASYGQRRMCSVSLILVVGLAALLWRTGQLAARARRVPRGVWHVLAILVLGTFVAWNIWRVRDLRAGKAAPAELEPTCCEKAPGWARPYMQWFYDRIGSPFQFPANVWFALKHDVELTRWDRAVGYYPLMPPAQALRDGTMYEYVGGWRIGYPLAEPYLIGGWSAVREGEGRALRWTLTPRVRVLVPNLMPEPQRFALRLAPGGSDEVTIRWDGEVVSKVRLHPGWQMVEWALNDVGVGEHELTIEATPAPFTPRQGWPTPKRPVGVAVNLLEVTLLPK